jgi:hypothetical protein
VTYTLFTGGIGDCITGTSAPAGGGTVIQNPDGTVTVPNSTPITLTAAGQYAYQASFTSSNDNYTGVSSDCEPFTVGQAEADPTTTVVDVSTKAPVSHNPLPLGATVFDTTSLTSTAGIAPTGMVTYTFFHSSGCIATTTAGTETVTIVDGKVPSSSHHGPLVSGSYAFKATYAGDDNYLAGISKCEPFSVDKAPLGLSTTVIDASTRQPASGTLPTGATVFDTAKLTTTSSITPTGTVTYAFYRSGTCITGTLVDTHTVTIGAGGSVPPSSMQGPLTTGGPYSFEAEYSSDSNFLGTGSGCEPLEVAIPVAPPAPITKPALPVTG